MNDEKTLDLTPRAVDTPKGCRRGGVIAIVVVLVLVGGFVLWQGLSNATLYFYNADEAVEQRDELADDRFRLQGTVAPDSLVEQPTGVEFDVQFNGVSVPVVHTGAPPELFREGMPVVLEGQWEGDVYSSDVILVKHDEVYEEENDDRLREADEGGTVDSPSDSRDSDSNDSP